MESIQQEEIIKIYDSSEKEKKNKNNISIIKIIFTLIIILLAVGLSRINNKIFFFNKNSNIKLNSENKNLEDNSNDLDTQNSRKKFRKFKFKKFKRRMINKRNKYNPKYLIESKYNLLKKEIDIPKLSEINKKRVFKLRYPLPKEINCYEHIKEYGLLDMMAFTSFLSKNITFFEFASGCSTIIAKYYSKKSYAVEGNRKWYDIGVKKGLKDNLIFKDLKCDGTGSVMSAPGKKSNLKDWKNFFQAYKKEYNADVIFIDGRFRVACGFDIFNKIKDDTVVLLHECSRPQYLILNKYYDFVYKWSKQLCLLKKKKNKTEIPIEIQKKYWNQMI